MTLDDEVKDAERQKFLAEANKARAEQKKLELDYNKQLQESKRAWYSKEQFWRNIVSIFLGFSILGFYLNFIIIPSFQKDNIELSLENSKHKRSLTEKEAILKEDSIQILRAKRENDSISALVYSSRIVVDSMRTAFKDLYRAVEKNPGLNSGKINDATHSVKQVLENLNMTPDLSSKTGTPKLKVEASIQFTKGPGQASLSVFSNGVLIQSLQLSQSGSIFIELPIGLYVFSISGVAAGEVTFDIQGKDITVSPKTPMPLPSGAIMKSFVVGVK